MNHKIEFELNDEQLIAMKAGELEIQITWEDGEIICQEIREVCD